MRNAGRDDIEDERFSVFIIGYSQNRDLANIPLDSGNKCSLVVIILSKGK